MRQSTAISLMAFFVLTGCSGIRTVSDYDREADFSSYSTFNFKVPDNAGQEGQPFLNHLEQRRLEAAITDEMALRGYIMSNRPDLWISYGIEPKSAEINPAQATLLMSIRDSRTNKVVWSGSVKGAMKEFEEAPTEAFREAVEALMVLYPYLAAKRDRFEH